MTSCWQQLLLLPTVLPTSGTSCTWHTDLLFISCLLQCSGTSSLLYVLVSLLVLSSSTSGISVFIATAPTILCTYLYVLVCTRPIFWLRSVAEVFRGKKKCLSALIYVWSLPQHFTSPGEGAGADRDLPGCHLIKTSAMHIGRVCIHSKIIF